MGVLSLDFDRRLLVQFRGSVVTSDAGCLRIANSMMRLGLRYDSGGDAR